MANGNYNSFFAKWIRTFETSTRFTLDLNAVPVWALDASSDHRGIPSHGVGIREYIRRWPKHRRGGAGRLILEVHPETEEALSDGPQSLLPEQSQIDGELRAVALAVAARL